MSVDVEQAYRRHGPMVRRRCQRLLGDPDLARDAMHDVFVRLVRRQDSLDDRALGALLFRMATQVSLTRLRTARRRPETPEDALVQRLADTDDPAARGLARAALDRLFGREPAHVQTLAVLHLVDGMTLAEVADATGLSVSGVRWHLRRLKGVVAELEEL